MQAVFDTIKGFASEHVIKLGKKLALTFDTPNLLKLRNPTDTAFARLQLADPEGNDDAVTLRYYNAHLPGAAPSNGLKSLTLPVGLTSTTASTEIPANAVIHSIDLEILTPYSAGTTLDIGSEAAPTALLGNAVVDEESQDFQRVPMRKVAPASFAPKVTVGGDPTEGGAVVILLYSTPAT